MSDNFGDNHFAEGYEDGYLQALEDVFVFNVLEVAELIESYAAGGWAAALAFAKTKEHKS